MGTDVSANADEVAMILLLGGGINLPILVDAQVSINRKIGIYQHNNLTI